MGRLAGIAFLGIVALGAAAQPEYHQRRADVAPQHTAWVAGVLRTTQTITVGMTRSDLMKIFTTVRRTFDGLPPHVRFSPVPLHQS